MPFCLTAAFIVCASCLQNDNQIVNTGNGATTSKTSYNWNTIADSSTSALNSNFWNLNGYYNNEFPSAGNFNYWPQAHALEVLVDAFLRTTNNAYLDFMNNWFVGVPKKNGNTFSGYYYDDMEWIALALERAHTATGDQKWMDATVSLWSDIITGWNTNLGGGIAWNKGQLSYKNTPANAPAAILSARLYKKTNNAVYLTWAKQIYDWEKNNLVDGTTGLVWDGINRLDNGQIDKSWKFAYNQGVFIGAALELYSVTGLPQYLSDAIKTADNFIADPDMSPNSIMRPGDTGDGGLFNGIGARYLALLASNKDVAESTRQKYVSFLTINATLLWTKGTDKTNVSFSPDFSKTPLSGNPIYLNPNLSGFILFEQMASLKKQGLVK